MKTVETKPNTFWIDVIVLDEQVFEPGPQVIYRPSFDFKIGEDVMDIAGNLPGR